MKKILSLLFAVAVVAFSYPKNSLPNTTWKALLHRTDGNNIPFTFETKDSAGKKIIYFHNAEERLLADSITITGDSIFVQMPFFDSRIEAKIMADGSLNGNWIKRLENESKAIPFSAIPNQSNRFNTSNTKPPYTITGRWAVQFVNTNGHDTTLSVGEFTQDGNRLTGSFLNPTGDYRFLEGVVEGDSLKLSCFDGGHAFLFTAKIMDDKNITGGYYYSGATHFEKWSAKKDSKAMLADEYGLTKIKSGKQKFNFSFRSIDGSMVSINDNRFKNKVVLLQIMGSWCPNCMDETRFLSTWYNQQKKKEVEIMALAYERSTNFERAQKNIGAFKKRFDVQYPMLVSGVTLNDSLRTEKTLPQLEKINAFPTLIFIDKKGTIRKIHSGFTGPGTGEHYQNFKDDFDKIIAGLIKEK